MRSCLLSMSAALALTAALPETGFASVATTSGKALRELAEVLVKQGGKEATDESIEAMTKQVAKMVARYGADAVPVMERYGVSAYRLLNDLPEGDGKLLVKSVRTYGDDAIRVAQTSAGREVLFSGSDAAIRAVIKYSDEAIPMIRKYGDDCARVLNNLPPQQGRRLIQLENEKLFDAAQFDQFVGVVGRYGERGMEYIWRNKKLLLAAGAFALFANDPEVYINGIRDLAKDLGNITLGPIVKNVNWNLWVGVLMVAASIRLLWRKPGKKRNHPKLKQAEPNQSKEQSQTPPNKTENEVKA